MADIGARPLPVIFEKQWRRGDVPGKRTRANVKAGHKKGTKEDAGNYRPINLTPVPGKIMEQVLLEVITNQMKQVTGKSRHGFTNSKSCQTNLITTYNETAFSVYRSSGGCLPELQQSV